MSEDKSPLEAALDVFVYGPLGLFITVTEEMPKLVEKGRQRLTSQLGMARMMGEMAAPHLQAEAEKLVRGVVDRVSPLGPPGGRDRAASQPAAPKPAPAPAPGTGPVANGAPPAPAPSAAPAGASRAPGAPSSPGPATTAPTNGSAGRSADSTHLAIPGYDTLSAMQVVQRLAGLTLPELEAVSAYESAHRGRKTILNRAEQLLSEPAG